MTMDISSKDFSADFIKAYAELFPDATEAEAEYIYRISSYDFIKLIIHKYTTSHYPTFKWG